MADAPAWASQVQRIMRGGTKLDPSAPNDLRRVEGIARLMGLPLLPWQRYTAALATQRDQGGAYMYDTVVISTPRQCGKSALVDVMDVYNASLGPDRRIIYSAQTGKDSEDHFKDLAKRIQASRLSQLIRSIRFGNGSMRMTFRNGSTIQPMAMTKVAGHGRQLDKVTIDEAFSLSAEDGATIDDAILPTMTTRLKATGIQPQRWITSTEGTAESEYFNGLIDALRDGKAPRRTCWVDFGIRQDDDPTDLDAILRTHPAAGYLWDRQQLKDFRASFGRDVAGFARAYGNRRDTGVADRLIPADTWDNSLTDPVDPATTPGRVTFAGAVDIDATHTSIAAAIRSDDGTITVQLVTVQPGTGDAQNALTMLAAKYDAPIVLDSKGPGAALADRVRRQADQTGLDLLLIGQQDYLTAGQAFVDGLSLGGIMHAPDPALDASAETCTRAWSGDAWRVSRRQSTGLTSPIEAAMLAAWAADHAQDTRLQIF